MRPEMTRVTVTADTDGYATVCVTKWDQDPEIPIGERKYVDLFNQTRLFGRWGEDKSATMNEYLKECGQFLEVNSDDSMAG